MPKRIVDGEALWASEKLAHVQPEHYRAELAWLIPLAMARGTFECSPRLIWGKCYAVNRPDWSVEDVTKLLGEFERVKLLFRWQEPDGKTWGYWVGIDKCGRLPSAARLKERHEKEGMAVPKEQLAEFLGQPAGSKRETVGQPIGSLGSGSGSGSGSGLGLGSGLGSGCVPAQPISSELTDTDKVLFEQEQKAAPISSVSAGTASSLSQQEQIKAQLQPISSVLADTTKGLFQQEVNSPDLPVGTSSDPAPAAPEPQTEATALCELLAKLIERPVAAGWHEDAKAILSAIPLQTATANTRWALDGTQDPEASKFWRRCTYSMKNLREHFLRAPAAGTSQPPIIAQYQQFVKRQQKTKPPADANPTMSMQSMAAKWGAKIND